MITETCVGVYCSDVITSIISSIPAAAAAGIAVIVEAFAVVELVV